MKRILVTGATGFLGEHVLALRPSDCEVSVFVRPTSDTCRIPGGVKKYVGRLEEPQTLREALKGKDLLINLASLGFGHAPAIIDACRQARIPRAVFVGTTAIFTSLPAKTKAVRRDAEQRLERSQLAYTLLRPTMIYGSPRDRNIWRLIRFLRWSPFAPVLDRGGLQQPVHVTDVARAVWSAAYQPNTIGKAYNIAGAEPLRFEEMIQEIARSLGRKVRIIPVPARTAVVGAAVIGRIPFLPKISAEQIQRLGEDKAFDNGPAREAFGYSPKNFATGLREELSWLR